MIMKSLRCALLAGISVFMLSCAEERPVQEAPVKKNPKENIEEETRDKMKEDTLSISEEGNDAVPEAEVEQLEEVVEEADAKIEGDEALKSKLDDAQSKAEATQIKIEEQNKEALKKARKKAEETVEKAKKAAADATKSLEKETSTIIEKGKEKEEEQRKKLDTLRD
ncbi:MAG: hypothetical protein ACQESK_00465 [Bacteroidota bacterium]